MGKCFNQTHSVIWLNWNIKTTTSENCVGSYGGDQMRIGQPDARLQVEKRNKPLKTFFFVNSEVWKDFSLGSIVTEAPTVNKDRFS